LCRAAQKKVRLLQILLSQLLAVVPGPGLELALNPGTMNEGKFLIAIPKGVSMHVAEPDFAVLLARRDLWYTVAM
jgi:hypothetical protein